jgi:hypothetical protein
MAGLRPVGPVPQWPPSFSTITRPCKDPGQGGWVRRGSPTSTAAISASTLARHRQNGRRPLIACSGGHSRGHFTRPYYTQPDRTEQNPGPTWPGQTQLDRSEQKIGSYLLNSGGLDDEIRVHVFPTRLRTTSGDDVGIRVAEWRWPDRTIAQCQSDPLLVGSSTSPLDQRDQADSFAVGPAVKAPRRSLRVAWVRR